MITPVSHLRATLIHMSPSYWEIHRSFEIILEWELSVWMEFKSNVLCKFIASKNIQSDLNLYFKKYLLQRVARALTDESE